LRDIMLEAVERRVAGMRALHPVEHLPDNRNPNISKETPGVLC